MAVPAPVQQLLAQWDAGELARGELVVRLLRELTSSNIDAVMEALPHEVLDAIVYAGCYAARPGEPVLRVFFGTAVGPVDLGPPQATEQDWPSEAVAAFDPWYRARYGRDAAGPVNRGIAALCCELHDHVAARDVSRSLYVGALLEAEELVPKDAPDRAELLDRVRWYEQWIGIGPGAYPPGLEPRPWKQPSR